MKDFKLTKTTVLSTICLGLCFNSFTAFSALLTTDNGLSVYVNGNTWTTDANLLSTFESISPTIVQTIINDNNGVIHNQITSTYTLTSADFGAYGTVTWYGAKAFVNYLNLIGYAGSNQWDLPYTDTSCQGTFNCIGSQLGELYYGELQGKPNSGFKTNALFTNMYLANYWSSTEYGSNPNYAWFFSTYVGEQLPTSKNSQADLTAPIPLNQNFLVWAVSPGEITPVPIPGAILLFCSGLSFLVIRVNRSKLYMFIK